LSPSQSFHLSGERGGVCGRAIRAGGDSLHDAGHRMVGEQLQHANELPAAGAGAQPTLPHLTQLGDDRGQLPVAVNRSVV
jgi:hypothetical protein